MKNNKGKHKGKNTMRATEKNGEVDLFFFKKKTLARLSQAALLAAFFGKLLKFKKSTRKTTMVMADSTDFSR